LIEKINDWARIMDNHIRIQNTLTAENFQKMREKEEDINKK